MTYSPRNTSADPKLNAILALGDAMSGRGIGSFIEEQERNGQAELVNSTTLPTEMGDRAAYEALGFTFGEPVKGDALFIEATLPAGWTREGSDHAMWSYLLDGLGRRRAAVFYKAAFYDREAHMHLETVYSYASSCMYDNRAPILDDEWATRDTYIAALEGIAKREDESAAEWRGLQPDSPYIEKSIKKAAEARAAIAELRSGGAA